MIPAISDHFIERAKERAPWLLQLDSLNAAISEAVVAERNNIKVILKNKCQPATYLVTPRLSKGRKSMVLVIENNILKTCYRTNQSQWASEWLSKTPIEDRKQYRAVANG